MSDLREKIARVLAEAALRNVGMEINELPGFTVEPWFEEADAVIDVLREQKPAATACADHSAGEMGYCLYSTKVSNGDVLYAAPVPPAEPVVPEGWALVPLDVIDRFPEINPCNYDHDDVCALNAWGVELVLAAPKPGGE